MNALTTVVGVLILLLATFSTYKYFFLSLPGFISGLTLLIIDFKFFNKRYPRLPYYLAVISLVSFFIWSILTVILSTVWKWNDVFVYAAFLLFYSFLLNNYKPEKKWRWKNGTVNTRNEYIELRYGNADSSSWESWLPVAYIAPAKNKTFTVHNLVQPAELKHEPAINAAIKEINFFLIDKKEADPWSYAKYHCSTAANIYSNIHWSYYPAGKTLPHSP